jgi:hypothetical protein
MTLAGIRKLGLPRRVIKWCIFFSGRYEKRHRHHCAGQWCQCEWETRTGEASHVECPHRYPSPEPQRCRELPQHKTRKTKKSSPSNTLGPLPRSTAPAKWHVVRQHVPIREPQRTLNLGSIDDDQHLPSDSFLLSL